MALRLVRVVAGGHQFTGLPIAQPTAIAVAEQITESMRKAGPNRHPLITLGQTDGFEHTVLRLADITAVAVVTVDDPDLSEGT